MLGDYLISHSYHLCSSLNSQFASRLIGRTTNQVCEGELLQINHRDNYDLNEETYFQIVKLRRQIGNGLDLEIGADALDIAAAFFDQLAKNCRLLRPRYSLELLQRPAQPRGQGKPGGQPSQREIRGQAR